MRRSDAAKVAGLPGYVENIADEDYNGQQEEARQRAATRSDLKIANDVRRKQSPARGSAGISSCRRKSNGGELQHATTSPPKKRRSGRRWSAPQDCGRS